MSCPQDRLPEQLPCQIRWGLLGQLELLASFGVGSAWTPGASGQGPDPQRLRFSHATPGGPPRTILPVTAKDQVTFRKGVLQHFGFKPGDSI